MTDLELTPDQVDALEQRQCDALLWSHGFGAWITLSPTERDALVFWARRGLAQAQATKEQP